MRVSMTGLLWLGSVLTTEGCAGSPVRLVGRDGATLVDSTFSLPSFGELHLVRSGSRNAPLAIFVSGDGGWDGTADRLAREIAHRGFAVVGVDMEQLRDRVEAQAPRCADLEALFALLAKAAHTRFKLSAALPVLVGHSAGATAVFVALAQSRRRVFAGAVSLSFARELVFPVPPCQVAALRLGVAVEHALHELVPPERRLHAPWSVILGDADDVIAPNDSRLFVEAVPGTHLWWVAGAGHGLDDSDATEHALDEALRTMSARDDRRHTSNVPMRRFPE